jgi:hypothetical protein
LYRKAESFRRHIRSRQNCCDPRNSTGPAHIEALDLCMRYGTTKKLAMNHRRQDDIHRIGGASRYGFRTVKAWVWLSYDVEASHTADYFFGGA